MPSIPGTLIDMLKSGPVVHPSFSQSPERHSCCNPRALILPRLYSHDEVDRKLLAFIFRRLMVTGHHLIYLQV